MRDLRPTPWEPTPVLECVTLDRMLLVLKEAGPLLEKATDRSKGRWDLGSLIDCLFRGEMNLWVALIEDRIVAACVTQILRYPRKKVCSMPFVGGQTMKHWLRFEEEIAAWAKAHGCSELVGYDQRNGAWLRVLPEWKRGHIEIVRPL